jgi:hypothetical protein
MRSPIPSSHRPHKTTKAVVRLGGVAVVLIVLASVTSGQAFGVVGGTGT